jgi:hypothetical protein
MTSNIPHSVLMDDARKVREAGGRVKHDKQSGCLDAFDPRGRPVIKAIQMGGTRANWIVTYTDGEVIKWGFTEQCK